jgi:hypothetical protein
VFSLVNISRSKDATHAFLLPESPISLPLPRNQIGAPSPQNINDPLSLLQNIDDPDMKVLKDFLSRILASPDVLNDPSFFKKDISRSTMRAMFVETCELEERKKAAHKNKQKAVSVAVVVNKFVETINPKDYPTLDSKRIFLETDRDIAPLLGDIIKLSKKVKLVDLLKVLNYALLCKAIPLQETSLTIKMGPSNTVMRLEVQRRGVSC